MGRMLETLTRADTRKERSAEPILPIAGKIAQPEPQPEAAPAPETAPAVEEHVPFIEVGGPRSLVDASADVLAAAPPPLAAGSQPIKHIIDTDQEEGAPPQIAGTIGIWCSWTLRKGIKRDQ
jgi:hypothetical protein